MSNVEWRNMWELTAWDKKFQGVDKSMQTKTISYRYLLAKDLFALSVPNGNIKLLSTGTQEGWTTEELAGEYLSEGEVVTIPWGKSPGAKNPVKYYHGRFVTGDNRIATSLDTSVLNNKFLYYWMCSNSDLLDTFYRGAGIQHPSMFMVLTMRVPLIPLEDQLKIVEILDTFTSSIENLKEQIAQRRKQYEYYRDQLLDLEGKKGVEMKPLGEIGEFIRGNGIQKSDFVNEGFGCIHYGQIHARYGFSAKETISKVEESLYKKCKKAKTGDVVLATTSEDAEDVAKPFVWLGDDDVAVSGDAFIFHHDQVGKFMGYQFMTHKFMQFKVKYATGAKVVRISGDNMAKFIVALPSISEQKRIVDILDKFEECIQNLEAQLAEREKQYEYYRNKLLTFE